MPITMDLDIPVETKLGLLAQATYELWYSEHDYSLRGEDAVQPPHVADYEHWKKTNKRSKR